MFCSSLSIYYLIISATLMSIYDLVVAKEAPSYLDRYCDNAKPRDDTNQTLFQENLNATLHELSTRSSSIDNRFYNTSYGLGSADTVYGLFLCRGDLSWDSCQQCINESIYESQKQCGDSVRGAIIWFNVCMLRYSDQNIFSKLEVNKKIWNNSSDNATDPGQFSATLSDLISELIEKVVSSSHFYASQALKATDSETIYGLMQCTQDLTPSDCKKCLIRNAIELPNHCDGKTGGEFLTPNCNFRFETSVFYTDIGHASPPPPPPNSKKFGTIGTIIGIAVAMVVLAILLLISWICILRKKAQKKYQFGKGKGGKASYDDRISIEQSLQFDLATIRAATNKFSPDNKIGEGGFGSVYKGTLPNGQEIAVKRLFKSPRQVVNEFKNEVEVVARLQHRNLVRLLGFCLDGEEKLLIYEFVPRKSLDYFLFDPTKRAQLDWPTSYQIIKGVAGGLLYLHEDSRLKIIHRDLKCGNILLDDDMNPKIADFGNARIFKNDQHGGSTSRVVGTYGYMSPEYAMLGQYSVKSDVFSFGILTLEIISGKRSTCFTQSSSGDDLVSCAWKCWNEGEPLEIMDPALKASCSSKEVIRCINIGLLCVQEDLADRPTMKNVVFMLNLHIPLRKPQRKPYSMPRSAGTSMDAGDLDFHDCTTKSYSGLTESIWDSDVAEKA